MLACSPHGHRSRSPPLKLHAVVRHPGGRRRLEALESRGAGGAGRAAPPERGCLALAVVGGDMMDATTPTLTHTLLPSPWPSMRRCFRTGSLTCRSGTLRWAGASARQTSCTRRSSRCGDHVRRGGWVLGVRQSGARWASSAVGWVGLQRCWTLAGSHMPSQCRCHARNPPAPPQTRLPTLLCWQLILGSCGRRGWAWWQSPGGGLPGGRARMTRRWARGGRDRAWCGLACRHGAALQLAARSCLPP